MLIYCKSCVNAHYRLLSFTPALDAPFYNHVTIAESKTQNRRLIMEIAARLPSWPAEISPWWSLRDSSASSPCGQGLTTPPSTPCFGLGPITITPGTSQTAQDWAGGKGSSGVWSVSSTDPEPACHPVCPPSPSQACQPSLTQARRRSRLIQACRPRGSQARRGPRLRSHARCHPQGIQARRSRVSQARHRPWLRSHARHRPRGSQARRSRGSHVRRRLRLRSQARRCPRLSQACRPPHMCLLEYSSFMMGCLGAQNVPQSSLQCRLQPQSPLQDALLRLLHLRWSRPAPPSSPESPSSPLVPASSAPLKHPPVPTPLKRPPVPTPPECPPVPAPWKRPLERPPEFLIHPNKFFFLGGGACTYGNSGWAEGQGHGAWSAMAPGSAWSTLEASSVSLSCTSLQGARPPSPMVLLRRGTRLPGGGWTVTCLFLLSSCFALFGFVPVLISLSSFILITCVN